MLYDLFDPRNPELPYLYEHFNWPHCEAKGLDFAAAAAKLPNAGLYADFSVYSSRIQWLNSTVGLNATDQDGDAANFAATQIRITR
mmetsp:Transcript_22710/g.59299  ORF Transcript_22710/g.59299 Transcript_22710/m.59299 type:complete len:86 (+) Transcript_22710:350-607(+)